jgi:hypothetical protein
VGTVTTYPFAFKVFQDSDVTAQVTAAGVLSELTLNSDYTVTLNGDQDASPGGNIVLAVALAVASILEIGSDVPATQDSTLTNAGGFPPAIVNAMADKLTILTQQQLVEIGRSIRVPELDGVSSYLPPVSERADTFLVFDPAGNPTVTPFTVAEVAVAIGAANLATAPADYVSVVTFMTLPEILDLQAGTLLTNHARAFGVAIATGKPVSVPTAPGWLYNMAGQTLLPSNTTIFGDRPNLRLANGQTGHGFRVADGAVNVEVRGMQFDGNKANCPAAGNGLSTGGTGASSVRFFNNYLFNWAGNGIYFGGTSVVTSEAVGNYATGNNLAGITMDANCTYMQCRGNFAWLNGTHGCGIIGVATIVLFEHNVCWSNGQAVPSADNLTGYNAANSQLTVTGNLSWGGLNNGMHFGGNDVTYTANIGTNAAQYGLVHQSSGTVPAVSNGAVMNGNILVGNGGPAGMLLGYCNSSSLTGNQSRGNTNHGAIFDNCSNVSLTGGGFRSNGGSGLRLPTPVANLSMTGVTCTDNGADGLRYDALSTSAIEACIFRNNAGAGINCSGSDAENMFAGNVIRDNGAGPVVGTFDVTTVWGVNNTDGSSTIASAATLTLPVWTDVFTVTGTTNITGIAASWPSRRVTLIASGVLTFVKGNNLKIASNHTSAGGFSALSLAGLGGNWIETGWSVN